MSTLWIILGGPHLLWPVIEAVCLAEKKRSIIWPEGWATFCRARGPRWTGVSQCHLHCLVCAVGLRDLARKGGGLKLGWRPAGREVGSEGAKFLGLSKGQSKKIVVSRLYVIKRYRAGY